VEQLCRKHGISSATYYKWKSKFGGLEASDIKRLKELEEENNQLKRMFANLSLENVALKDLIGKKALAPDEKRRSVNHLVNEFKLTIAHACRAIGFNRSSYYRAPKDWHIADKPIIDALNGILEKAPQAGFWKCFYRLKNKHYPWNHKRIYRVYCRLGLNKPRRIKKQLDKRTPAPLEVANKPNAMWALDFVHDSLYSGKRFRTLNVIDEGTRECLAIEVDTSLPAARVVRVLEQLAEERGALPKQIRLDNGPELIADVMVQWCEQHDIELAYIQPGKPQQNAFAERFNGSFRKEFLNAYLFDDLEQVRDMAWHWMLDYNNERPHESIGNIPPSEYHQS
ncbi:IS3 family transposase, partial [Paraferrimonas sp. SM1919]|uniref:IS3 family transposase n=1 Tax=Paraferrimonas sp. SM1919 TaxID=2662263 RepID=UPI001F08DAE7